MIVKLQLTVFLWFYSPQAVTKNSALRCPGVGIALAVAVLEGGGGPDSNFGVLGSRDGHPDESNDCHERFHDPLLFFQKIII